VSPGASPHIPFREPALEVEMSSLRAKVSRLVRGMALAAAMVVAPPALAAAVSNGAVVDESELRRVEAYLNGLGSLQAGFVQIAANGAMSTGRLYLDRPSRMRLDYDPPVPVLIIAAYNRIVYYDSALEQVSYIPIGRTPLGFLLAREIRLGGDVVVLGLERLGSELHLRLAQTDQEAQGEVTLVFGAEPLELRRWSVTDAQGLTTDILLQDVETGIRLARDLFEFRDPGLFGDPLR
jgi:outer membrane lipoprotein-sorting protein